MPVVVRSSRGPGIEGASINPIYVHRQMKAYAVTENEIGQLSFYNTASAVLFSLGTFFVSLAVGIKLNESFVPPPLPPSAEFLSKWGIVAAVIGAIAFYALGALAIYFGRSAWKTIREESKSQSTPQA